MSPSPRIPVRFIDSDPYNDPDFKKSWEKVIDLSTDTKFQSKLRKSVPEIEDNNYFHAGLNLDNILNRKPAASPKRLKVADTEARPATDNVPKYHFVEMLQSVFGKPDLISNNRFINPCVAERLRESKQGPKRVRFSLTEIGLKHLPNCRRFSIDSEHGFLHAPRCKNYVSEKELSTKEFECRANFLRTNLKPERSEVEFYSRVPTDEYETRPSPSPLPLTLDLKASLVDSKEIHEKNSPGIRRKDTDCEIKPELNRLSSTENSLQYHHRQNNPFKPAPEVNVEQPSPMQMSFQPIFSDAPIGGPKFSDAPLGGSKLLPSSLNLQEGFKTSPAGSCDSGYADELLNDLQPDLSDIESDDEVNKPTVETTTLQNDNDDLLNDLMDDFSDDDSEAESINAPTPKVESNMTQQQPESGIESDEESEPVWSLGLTISEMPFSPPTKLADIQSCSDSDSDVDISEELADMKTTLPSRFLPSTLWFKKPSPNTPEPPQQKPETQDTNSKIAEIQTEYINPFSKKSTDNTIRLTAPSTLAVLVCSTKPSLLPDRLPVSAPDREHFLFDTMSPDDIIRNRQASVF